MEKYLDVVWYRIVWLHASVGYWSTFIVVVLRKYCISMAFYVSFSYFIIGHAFEIFSNKRAQRALGRSPEEKVMGPRWSQYIDITKYWKRTSRWCYYIPNMKALGLVVSDKFFENCILKTYFLTPWPTYATNQNHLNNFGRGPPRDHSCRVWSNYH